MSNFYNPSATRIARKSHKCTYCSEIINKGDSYSFQKGNYDGHWFESKMHFECCEDFFQSGDDSYTPYSNERPIKQ